MAWTEYIAVGLGGTLGAIARYAISDAVQRAYGGDLPAGTMVVNLLGCLALGILAAIAEGADGLSETTRLAILVGLLGSFTTFSTFAVDIVGLLETRQYATAAASLAGAPPASLHADHSVPPLPEGCSSGFASRTPPGTQ